MGAVELESAIDFDSQPTGERFRLTGLSWMFRLTAFDDHRDDKRFNGLNVK